MEKVFLSLLHNILNALLGGCHAVFVFGSGSCVSPESSSIVRVNKKLSSRNPFYEKVRFFNRKLSCARIKQAFLEFLLRRRLIFCTILSESMFHTMLNTEMYKNPHKVYIFSLILLSSAG